MDRVDVYAALDSERDYQDFMTASDDRPDMVEINLAAGIVAMEQLLLEARAAWYVGTDDHQPAMALLRKIGGLAVKMGEQYGMPRRQFAVRVNRDEGGNEIVLIHRVIPHGGHTDDAYQLEATDGRIFREGQVVEIVR